KLKSQLPNPCIRAPLPIYRNGKTLMVVVFISQKALHSLAIGEPLSRIRLTFLTTLIAGPELLHSRSAIKAHSQICKVRKYPSRQHLIMSKTFLEPVG